MFGTFIMAELVISAWKRIFNVESLFRCNDYALYAYVYITVIDVSPNYCITFTPLQSTQIL